MELIRVDCPVPPKSHDKFFGFQNEDGDIEGVAYMQGEEVVQIGYHSDYDYEDHIRTYSIYVSSLSNLIKALTAAQEHIRSVENKDAI